MYASLRCISHESIRSELVTSGRRQNRSRIKQEKQLNQLSLKILFGTKLGQDFLFEFLKETSIATRKWLLQQIE